MSKKYGLTETEMEIMEEIWKREETTFKELLEYFNGNAGRGWRKQTLGSYLNKLKNQGLLLTDETNKNFRYCPAITKKQLIKLWTRKLVDSVFHGSIPELIAAFAGDEKLDEKEITELREYLESL